MLLRVSLSVAAVLLCAMADHVVGAKKPRGVVKVDFAKAEHITAFQMLKHGGNASYPLAAAVESALDASPRPSAVLAYVTPWNRDGYARAIQLRDRITHVSPVWYDIKAPVVREGKVFITISGDHNFNETWCTAVTSGGARVVPRFQFDAWGEAELSALFSVDDKAAIAVKDALAKPLAAIFKRRHQCYSGLVIEWGHMSLAQPGLEVGAAALLQHIRRVVESGLVQVGTPTTDASPRRRADMILVVSPDPQVVGAAQLKWLVEDGSLDFISVMSYDFAPRAMNGRPGPNAPFEWFDVILRGFERHGDGALASRVLMGLNHYGYMYRPSGGQPEAVTGRDVLKVLRAAYVSEKRRCEATGEVLKSTPPLRWSTEHKEHSFSLAGATAQGDALTYYYPTRAALAHRWYRARNAGAGVAIWELGQGMEYFDALFPKPAGSSNGQNGAASATLAPAETDKRVDDDEL